MSYIDERRLALGDGWNLKEWKSECLKAASEVDRLHEALARVERELDEAAKRAHKHRLAFDWMVAEMVPDASLDDIEQLWQEAHTALRSDGGQP